jgi:hypothetical protein
LPRGRHPVGVRVAGTEGGKHVHQAVAAEHDRPARVGSGRVRDFWRRARKAAPFGFIIGGTASNTTSKALGDPVLAQPPVDMGRLAVAEEPYEDSPLLQPDQRRDRSLTLVDTFVVCAVLLVHDLPRFTAAADRGPTVTPVLVPRA